MKTIFIAWAKTSRRSESLSKSLKANLYLIHYKFREKKYFLIKYAYLSLKTLMILIKQSPDVIFAQNPPLFCPLVCLIYAKIFKKKLIIDAHTSDWKTVFDRLWYWNHFIMNKADMVIVTNRDLINKIAYNDVNFFVLQDRVPALPKYKKLKLKRNNFNIGVVNTFSADEPVDQILITAKNLPYVNFYITGNTVHAKKHFLKDKPANVFFTGFLPENKYIGLLRAVDAVIVLTTRNYTVLSGAYEAVSVGKPMIISDWPVLRKYFNMGAVYTNNNWKSIKKAVESTIKNRRKLNREIKILRNKHLEEWDKKIEILKNQMRCSL